MDPVFFRALVCDYDGTLATLGKVTPEVVSKIRAVKDSGRKLILATGRVLPELWELFPEMAWFDRVIAENGALLYRPERQEELVLTEGPPASFMDALKKRRITPLTQGRVVIATVKPFDIKALETIRELGLELTVTFNKSSVMILPSGVNKATGLKVALEELGVKPEEIVGVGDAENDHAFLQMCGFSAALANAVDSLKQNVRWVADYPNGMGVRQLIEKLQLTVPLASTVPPSGSR